MLPQNFNICDKMAGRVVFEGAEGARAPGAALVVDDDAVIGRIEKAPIASIGAGAGTAVQKQHGHAIGATALLPDHDVGWIEGHLACCEGLDVRIKLGRSHSFS